MKNANEIINVAVFKHINSFCGDVKNIVGSEKLVKVHDEVFEDGSLEPLPDHDWEGAIIRK